VCDLSVEHSIGAHFATLEDPRCPIQRRHKLIDLIVIAIAATLSGADGWVAIAAFAQVKEAWLRSFLELPDGRPSHDTFGRVLHRQHRHQCRPLCPRRAGSLGDRERIASIALGLASTRRGRALVKEGVTRALSRRLPTPGPRRPLLRGVSGPYAGTRAPLARFTPTPRKFLNLLVALHGYKLITH